MDFLIKIKQTNTLNQNEIWDAIKHLRAMDFGVALGTIGESGFKCELVHWPTKKTFDYVEAGTPEDAIKQSIMQAIDFLSPV